MSSKHYSWGINPGTGDYLCVNGSPVRDESLDFPVYARLKVERGTWLYAPDRRYGSTLAQVKRQSNQTPTLLANVMKDALVPLITSRRARDIVVEKVSSVRFREELGVTYFAADGQPSTFTFSPLEK